MLSNRMIVRASLIGALAVGLGALSLLAGSAVVGSPCGVARSCATASEVETRTPSMANLNMAILLNEAGVVPRPRLTFYCSVRVDPDEGTFKTRLQVVAYVNEVLRLTRQIPGVSSATIADGLNPPDCSQVTSRTSAWNGR